MARIRPTLLLVPLLVLLTTIPALAEKEYKIPEIHVEALITSDGLVQIREHRTYVFDGSFTWASYRLPKRGYREIRDLRILEGEQAFVNRNTEEAGTFRVLEDDSDVELQWYYEAEDTTRTFTVEYTLVGALVTGDEWTEFFWTWAAKGREKSTEVLEVELRLPGEKNGKIAESELEVGGDTAEVGANSAEAGGDPSQSIYAWSRLAYPIADIDINGRTVSMRVNDLRRSRAFPVRVLFPVAWLNLDAGQAPYAGQTPYSEQSGDDLQDTYTAVIRDPSLTLERVLAEESQWQAEVERERATREQLLELAPSLSALLSALGILVFVLVYRTYGTKPKPTYGSAHVRRITPNPLPPALAGRLLNASTGSAGHLTSTLFDLARRGYLMLEERPVEKKWYSNETTEFVLSMPTQGVTKEGTPSQEDNWMRESFSSRDLVPGVERGIERDVEGGIKRDVQRDDVRGLSGVRTDEQGLLDWERSLLDFVEMQLLKGNHTFKKVFNGNRSAFPKWYRKWDGIVRKTYKAQGWFDSRSYIGVTINAIVQSLLLISSIILLVKSSGVMIPALLITGILLIASFAVIRRTEKGEMLYQEWKSYKDGLKDGSMALSGMLDEGVRGDGTDRTRLTPDRHFIYATAMGIHGKKMKALVSRISQNDMNAIFPWIFLMPGSSNTPATVAASLNTLTATATASVSSVAGGGGASAGAAGGGASGGAG